MSGQKGSGLCERYLEAILRIRVIGDLVLNKIKMKYIYKFTNSEPKIGDINQFPMCKSKIYRNCSTCK